MRAFSLPTYLHIVRASALYDLVVTAGFATPWTFPFIHRLMSGLNEGMGAAPLPAFGPFHMLIAGLLGSIVVVWSLLRIREPAQRLGRHDGAARLLFSAWMAWTLHATGAPLLWLLLVPEFAWGVIQWWPVSPGEGRRDRALVPMAA
ncbi:hypothetical protein G4G28_19165 [Massilia sp. Dwa41.01b]|uniref:hypothetical protein n=1 Tax=unclassified Massilia TaxID=2609279 RepID=UPI0016020AD9|nr:MULTISPECIES: hypothetical protein [unclassified Massilia]QNA90085.1 hypothetical protein G4G28_19165 [Massilia sp. Dwa41.01b]QNB00975.1 hypothetical protein G4G31_22770 [Massilia sp. Se16.2.3]